MQAQYDKLTAELEQNPELLQEILTLSDAMRELSDHAISRILHDSILYLNALKPWYETVRTPIAKYSLAEVYVYESKFDQAETVLKEIPILFSFNDLELKEHENYMKFYNFKKQMLPSERNWRQLDESEISQLQTIAEATQGRSASMAKGVLCFFYDICYDDNIEEKDGEIILSKNTDGEQTDANVQTQGIASLQPNLTLYPNPTHSEMTVALDNPAVKIAEMELYDITNRKVHQQTVNQPYGILKLDKLAQGVYILKVYLDNKDVINRKIIKKKKKNIYKYGKYKISRKQS
jgi:hypothetical protein